MVELGGGCEIKHGFAFKGEFFDEENKDKSLPIILTPGNYSEEGGLFFNHRNVKRYKSNDFPNDYFFNKGDLTIVMTDLSPKMKILGNPAIIEDNNILHNQRIGKIVLKSNKVLTKFIYYTLFLKHVKEKIKLTATGSLVKHTSPSRILECKIPLPPLSEQKEIVAAIEKEQSLVSANKELISLMEAKIKAKIAKIWGNEEEREVKQKNNGLYSVAEQPLAMVAEPF